MFSRIAIALSMVCLIVGSTHYYIWTHLVRDTGLPPPWATVGTVVLVVLALLLPIAMASRFLPKKLALPLMWVAFTWMGLFFLIITLLGVTDLLRVVATLLWTWTPHVVPDDPEHRLLAMRISAGSVTALALAIGGVALRSALGGPQVERVQVPLNRLPASLDGYVIAQISDLHVAALLGRSYVEQVVERVNSLQPRLIAVTGDLVDGSVDDLRDSIAPLAKLRAPDGVFFVTGNHEYYSGVERWLQHYRELGMRPLRNERVSIGTGADTFDLAGIDDWTAHQFGGDHGADLKRALDGRDVSREVVLLAHQPKAVVEAAELGVGLVLSGHTHGGQIWPFNYLVRLQQPYVAGLAKHGPTYIYVNRGTGYWGPPMRLGAPPEVTRLELRRS